MRICIAVCRYAFPIFEYGYFRSYGIFCWLFFMHEKKLLEPLSIILAETRVSIKSYAFLPTIFDHIVHPA